jgi:hypothetical protein
MDLQSLILKQLFGKVILSKISQCVSLNILTTNLSKYCNI